MADGPTGLVGTNSPDSKATVEKMLEDRAQGRMLGGGTDDVAAFLKGNGIDFVSWDDWRRLDAWEKQEGEKRGKVRHKEPSVEALKSPFEACRLASSPLTTSYPVASVTASQVSRAVLLPLVGRVSFSSGTSPGTGLPHAQ